MVMMSASPWPLVFLSAVIAGLSYRELAEFGSARPGFPVAAALLLVGSSLYVFAVSSGESAAWIPILQLVGLFILGSIVAPQFVVRQSRLLLEVSSFWFVCPLLALCILQ